MDLTRAAKRRGCSLDVLINSALAEWLSEWYSDGQPKKFQEIFGIVARDDFLNSAEDHLLELYFRDAFRTALKGPRGTQRRLRL